MFIEEIQLRGETGKGKENILATFVNVIELGAIGSKLYFVTENIEKSNLKAAL
jgi:hypothetical protein